MINFSNVYATVFNPSRNDRKTALANLSTSRRNVNKQTNETTYINSAWGTVSFLGEADKKFDTLKSKDRIYILKGRIERVKGLDRNGGDILDASGRPVYYLNLTIFDFCMASEVDKNNTNSVNGVVNPTSTNEEQLPF